MEENSYELRRKEIDPEGGQGLACTVQPVETERERNRERERERERVCGQKQSCFSNCVSFVFVCFLLSSK